MPFQSKSQKSYLWANHPEIAKRWEAHTPKGKKLPEKKKEKTVDKKAFTVGFVKFCKESGIDPLFMLRRPGERYLTTERHEQAIDKKTKRLEEEKKKYHKHNNPKDEEKTVDKKAFVRGVDRFCAERGLDVKSAYLVKKAFLVGGALGTGIGALANPGDRAGGAVRGATTGAGIGAGMGIGAIPGSLGMLKYGPKGKHIGLTGMRRSAEAMRGNPKAYVVSALAAILGAVAGGTLGGVAGHAIGSRISPPKEEPKTAGFVYGVDVFCRQAGVDKKDLAKAADVDDVDMYLASVVNA